MRNKKQLPKAVGESRETEATAKGPYRGRQNSKEQYSDEYWQTAMEEHIARMANSEKAPTEKIPSTQGDPTLARILQQAIRKAIKKAKQLRKPRTSFARHDNSSQVSGQTADSKLQPQTPSEQSADTTAAAPTAKEQGLYAQDTNGKAASEDLDDDDGEQAEAGTTGQIQSGTTASRNNAQANKQDDMPTNNIGKDIDAEIERKMDDGGHKAAKIGVPTPATAKLADPPSNDNGTEFHKQKENMATGLRNGSEGDGRDTRKRKSHHQPG